MWMADTKPKMTILYTEIFSSTDPGLAPQLMPKWRKQYLCERASGRGQNWIVQMKEVNCVAPPWRTPSLKSLCLYKINKNHLLGERESESCDISFRVWIKEQLWDNCKEAELTLTHNIIKPSSLCPELLNLEGSLWYSPGTIADHSSTQQGYSNANRCFL